MHLALTYGMKVASDKLAISPELRQAAGEKRQKQLSGLLALQHNTTGELSDFNAGTPSTAARLQRQVGNFQNPGNFSLKTDAPVASAPERSKEFVRQRALHTAHMPGGAAADKVPAGFTPDPDLYAPTAPRRGLLRRFGPALALGGAAAAGAYYLGRKKEG
jgi:hypothetical protein